jgi:hypothetical protein
MSTFKNSYATNKIKIEIETNDIQEAINFLKKYEEETKKEEK